MSFVGDVMPTCAPADRRGELLALIAIAALAFGNGKKWLNLALGLWLVASPWMLGLPAIPPPSGPTSRPRPPDRGDSAWAVWD